MAARSEEERRARAAEQALAAELTAAHAARLRRLLTDAYARGVLAGAEAGVSAARRSLQGRAAELVRLLNLGLPARPGDRRRLWVAPGVPVLIGQRLVLRLQRSRQIGREAAELVVQVRGPGLEWSAELPGECWVDLSHLAGLQLVPRAVRADGAVLVEFVRTDGRIQWAV